MKKNIILIFIILFATGMYAQRNRANKPVAGRQQTKVIAKPNPLTEKYDKYKDLPIVNVEVKDSFVTTEANIPQAINMPSYAGILTYKDSGIVWQNEFGTMRLYASADSSGEHHIYQQTMVGNEWSEPELLPIEGDLRDMRSPFLRADGQTLYLCAKDGEDISNEKYNIYMSTLDMENGSFRKPQRLPLPFHTDSDDLYFIDNELDNIAYFITTHNQAFGKVCIFTIKTTEPWIYLENDKLTKEELIKRAELR